LEKRLAYRDSSRVSVGKLLDLPSCCRYDLPVRARRACCELRNFFILLFAVPLGNVTIPGFGVVYTLLLIVLELRRSDPSNVLRVALLDTLDIILCYFSAESSRCGADAHMSRLQLERPFVQLERPFARHGTRTAVTAVHANLWRT
jgi:hypothetical protein